MTRGNHCEFFRFNDKFCDVFIKDDHFLFVECEPFGWPELITCKEYKHSGGGFIVSAYQGVTPAYLAELEPAPESVAVEVIASEYRYQLEKMAPSYGYSAQYAADCFRECLADCDGDPVEAFYCIAFPMIEYDL